MTNFLEGPAEKRGYCRRLPWRYLTEALTEGKKSARWRSARRTLCFLQEDVFAALAKALMGESSHEVSWDSPTFACVVPVPPKAVMRHLREHPELDSQDCPLQDIVIDLQVLTAGAAITMREDEMLAALLVDQLLDPLALLTRAQIEEFAQSWCDPVCFGDRPGDGSLSIELRGGLRVTADVSFRVHPWFSSHSTSESFHCLEAGIAWPAEVTPREWSDSEKAAALKVLSRTFAAMLSEAQTGRMSPWRIEERVRDGTAVSRFTFDIRTSGPSDYFRRCLPRTLEETPLAGLYLNPYCADQEKAPVLDVIDEEGCIHDFALGELFAAMFLPSDPELREEIRSARLIAELSQQGLEQLAGISGLLPLLARAAPKEATLQRATKRALGGALCGDVLLTLLTLAQHAPEHASVGKAIFIEEQVQKGQMTYGGRPVRAGTTSIRNAWTTFKPVAHLWAAYRIYQFDDEGDIKFFPESPEEPMEPLRNFLTLAECIRLEAVGLMPRVRRSQGGPVLDPHACWRLPDGFVRSGIRFTTPAITDRWEEALAEYERRDR